MTRVKLQALTYREGVNYREGKLFTGISFRVADCRVQGAWIYHQGRALGQYASQHPATVDHIDKTLKVTADCLKADAGGSAFFEGRKFTGVAYHFCGDFCEGETVYHEGHERYQILYHPSGAVAREWLFDGDFLQDYSWFEDGRLHRLRLAGDSFEILVRCTREGQLSGLRIDGDYLEMTGEIAARIAPRVLVDRPWLLERECGPVLNLEGSGIGDDMLGAMMAGGLMDSTVQLHIGCERLSADAINRLASLSGLRVIYFAPRMLKSLEHTGPELQRQGRSRLSHRAAWLLEPPRSMVSARPPVLFALPMPWRSPLRVNERAISLEGRRAFHDGKPFSGIGFRVDECLVVSAIEYRDGVPVNGYVNHHLSRTASLDRLPKVDSACLEGSQPVCFAGEPFTGVAYSFDGDICTGERIYRRGTRLRAHMQYFRSGNIATIDLYYADFGQYYSWHETGAIHWVDLTAEDFLFLLQADSSGAVMRLEIDGVYFERIAGLDRILRSSLLEERECIARLQCGGDLALSGSMIDDALILLMVDNEVMQETWRLTISDSALTPAGLDCLAGVRNLSSLEIENCKGISLQDVLEFRSRRPDCSVNLDRRMVGR